MVENPEQRTALISPEDPDPPKLPPGEWPIPPRRGRKRTRNILKEYERPSHRFPWRIIVYSLALAYLVFDLYILDGPLRRRIDATRPGSASIAENAVKYQWVALVNGQPITAHQLDRATQIHNFKRGITTASLSPINRRLNRMAVLEELVEDELVRGHAENSPVPLDDAELEAAISRFSSQFPSTGSLHSNLRAQKIAPRQLKDHIARHVRQLAWIEHNIAAAITVSEEEARAWFDRPNTDLNTPELVRARHIFLSTVEEDSPAREKLIREIHRRLTNEEASFEELAREFSEDPRTAENGGDLSYFSRRRMPADFTDVVFNLDPGRPSPPFRTTLGWHIAELIEKKPARNCSFEEVKTEILHLLESAKREIAVRELIARLRENSVIQLFPATLDSNQMEADPTPVPARSESSP